MKIHKYFKNLIKFISKGGIKQGGVMYAKIGQIQYGKILEGKNILITGGSTGIGFEIAKKCINEGANVIIIGRDKEKLLKAQNELGNEKCNILEFDMTRFEEYDSIIDEIANLCSGKLDYLVNNAGVYIYKEYKEYTMNDYDKIFNTNMKSIYFLTKKILEKFETLSNILMISSETSLVGNDGPYGLSKATLNNYTKGLAKKLYEDKKYIRVNAILPGATISQVSDYSKSFEKNQNIYEDNVLGNRILLPEEIAEVACFLLSDASKCINGQIIACNEGNILN